MPNRKVKYTPYARFAFGESVLIPASMMLAMHGSDRMIANPTSSNWVNVPKRTSDMPNANSMHVLYFMLNSDGSHRWNSYVGFGTSSNYINSIMGSSVFDSNNNLFLTVHTSQDGLGDGRLVRFYDASSSAASHTLYQTFESGEDKAANIINLSTFGYPESFLLKHNRDSGELEWVKRFGFDGDSGSFRWEAGTSNNLIYDSTNDRVIMPSTTGRNNKSYDDLQNKFRAGFGETDEWGYTPVAGHYQTQIAVFDASNGNAVKEPSLYFNGSKFSLQWFGYETSGRWTDGNILTTWYLDDEFMTLKRAEDDSTEWTNLASIHRPSYYLKLMKLNPTSNVVWTRDIWGTYNSGASLAKVYPQATKVLSDGGFLTLYRAVQQADTHKIETSSGEFTISLDSSILSDSYSLVRFDNSGDVVWTSTFGNTTNTNVLGIIDITLDDEEAYCYILERAGTTNGNNIRFNPSNTVPAPSGTVDLDSGTNGNNLVTKFDLSNGAALWTSRAGTSRKLRNMFFNDGLWIISEASSPSDLNAELVYGSGELPPTHHGSISTNGNVLYVAMHQLDISDGSYLDGSKKLILLVDNNGDNGINFTNIQRFKFSSGT